VELSKIPLYLATGPVCDVSTASARTKEFFDNLLLSTIPRQQDNEDVQDQWWHQALQQSPIGVLAQVTSNPASRGEGTTTEILFYGVVQPPTSGQDPPTPPPSSPNARNIYHSVSGRQEAIIRVRALPLSSDFLSHLPTPPLSPTQSAVTDRATFLPSIEEVRLAEQEIEKKRKRVSDVFDEAAKTRKKARRKGGLGVAAAASRIGGINTLVGQKKSKNVKLPESCRGDTVTTGMEPQRPNSKPEKAGTPALKSAENQVEPIARRPISRSPSISSESRPLSRRDQLDCLSKRSSLSRITSLSDAASVEDRNKEAISRVVMAGMRLHGMQQRKKPVHARRGSEVSIMALSTGLTDTAKEDEYKLVYHQTYKAAVFTFASLLIQCFNSICRLITGVAPTEKVYHEQAIVPDARATPRNGRPTACNFLLGSNHARIAILPLVSL